MVSKPTLNSAMYKVPVYLGSDPEIGIVDAKGTPVPADRLFQYKNKSGGEFYADGFFLEISPSPDVCRETLVSRMFSIISMAKDHMDIMSANSGLGKLKFVAEPTLAVTPEIMATAGPQSKISGCKPDFNAYNGGAPNPVMEGFEFYPYRHGGCHIHFGYFEKELKKIKEDNSYDKLVRLMDLVVGNTMNIIDPPSSLQRRDLVGAGYYRKPKWGLEYRSLSNYVMLHPVLVSMAFGLARIANNIFFSDGTEKELWEYLYSIGVKEDLVRRAINTGNSTLSAEIYRHIRFILFRAGMFETRNVTSLFNGYGYGASPACALQYILDGKYKFDNDMEKNWNTLRETSAAGSGFILYMSRALENDKVFTSYQKNLIPYLCAEAGI